MKCIIVEDEFPAREELKYFIKNHSNIEIVSEFDNGIDVLKFIQENSIDVIFLDINIPMLDGILLAKTINKFKYKPKIVFITAYKEHAVEAFELEAFDYVLKPYSDQRIINTLNKLKDCEENEKVLKREQNLEEKSDVQDTITMWKNDKIIVLKFDDIYYCEANERETIVYTKENEYIVKSSISEFLKSLPSNQFFKTHRSYIVNINKIKEIIPWFNSTYILKLNDIKKEIPVSRSNIKEFRNTMHI
ncbi:LytR/AlgR family response regulator transcription factor [Paraclostridium bifermentans]|uniref:LytR/AlgR family response regulator transcription factor n=1 Tax=Paraclostridium bifermentans TaxID=1490 RepID=UPI00115BB2ED|nr:LytTR family DNA-binding domain-containing protein [Paraclostridium bifermentans]MCR1875091.1 LytTR family DNA-binding domain-containing protein [Paraclostridium bifermentans]TQO58084.1 DNA-binding response regulator [Paraclostridium bifermentans]GKZ01880.1 DNA-binding response regulator [Paraclostridium bifermentans]GKZ07881.1 DNA-binding response regulator [Paraclostridium bifermentans]GKZ09438.1 DNA-binding response regulator [Paraclostridium bifermentans]